MSLVSDQMSVIVHISYLLQIVPSLPKTLENPIWEMEEKRHTMKTTALTMIW